ncbi:hypothetical protein PTKU15_82760 [Paraburkholderia terrae]|nr:hypothetical protein PTKU15_82760 [Paraburkholderia terrae]
MIRWVDRITAQFAAGHVSGMNTHILEEQTMTAESGSERSTLTHAAIWALERLAQQRYGRGAPALNWSVERELRNAGFVSIPTQGRGSVTITRAGQEFLRARAEL